MPSLRKDERTYELPLAKGQFSLFFMVVEKKTGALTVLVSCNYVHTLFPFQSLIFEVLKKQLAGLFFTYFKFFS